MRVILAAVVTLGVGALSLYREVIADRLARRRQQRADTAALTEFERTRRHLR